MMRRREFVKINATATLGFSLSSIHLDSFTIKPLNKKSLKWGMIQEGNTILEKFQLIKDLGYDGVELDSPNNLNVKEILEAQQKTGLLIPGVVNSVHWKSPMSDNDPAVRTVCTESMKTALKDCKMYGGNTVLLVPAVVNENVSYADAYQRAQTEIKKLIPTVEATGIKIALENVWNNFLLSPLEAARFLDEINHPMIGWYFDIGNIVRYGWPEHWIKTLGHRIMKIDIKDYSRKRASDEGIWKGFDIPLGKGDANYTAVNKALAEIGYSGWGSAEVAGGDRKRLQQIKEEMDVIYAL